MVGRCLGRRIGGGRRVGGLLREKALVEGQVPEHLVGGDVQEARDAELAAARAAAAGFAGEPDPYRKPRTAEEEAAAAEDEPEDELEDDELGPDGSGDPVDGR